ncbi:hypothetical protein ACMBCN_01135, partial [Candidatus Liberibacter asiaticus]|nr:hypothetical protein [Candidatus Liberibacter asiaticus]
SFSFSFLSSSFSLPHSLCVSLQRVSKNYLKTLFTQLECLLWISEGDSFLLKFLPLFIEEKKTNYYLGDEVSNDLIASFILFSSN